MKVTTQTERLLNELKEAIADQSSSTYDIAMAVDKLRMGDYYGDPLPDAIADIAKSLRILSGREKLD